MKSHRDTDNAGVLLLDSLWTVTGGWPVENSYWSAEKSEGKKPLLTYSAAECKCVFSFTTTDCRHEYHRTAVSSINLYILVKDLVPVYNA